VVFGGYFDPYKLKNLIKGFAKKYKIKLALCKLAYDIHLAKCHVA
jgi:hypothetical protein